MVTANGDLPDHLLQAVAERSGRITLVVGAGCSLEPPTNLRLSQDYSLDVHTKLVRDGVLTDGQCAAPEDLSAVATAVWAKRESQAEVVTRLPRTEFRNAKANSGYRVAAALMREGAVSAVLTLNFDLALSDALSDLSAHEVNVIAGPRATGDLGSSVVVYLHRNVNEADLDQWILRVEALQQQWLEQWEQVLSQRLMSAPVVVFAGLGSPAAVLTETIGWIRQRLDPQQHRAYVVDPAATTAFKDALDLSDDAHIRSGWCGFMTLMADRLVTQLDLDLRTACTSLCDANGWNEELADVDGLSAAFFERGLVDAGMTRAKWLMRPEEYTHDEPLGRELLADLLLGVGLAHRLTDTTLMIRRDGVAELRKDNRVLAAILPVSGRGTHRWTAIEPTIMGLVKAFHPSEKPNVVLIAGMPDSIPEEVVPPEDVILGETLGDVVAGPATPLFIEVDSLRHDPAVADRIAS